MKKSLLFFFNLLIGVVCYSQSCSESDLKEKYNMLQGEWHLKNGIDEKLEIVSDSIYFIYENGREIEKKQFKLARSIVIDRETKVSKEENCFFQVIDKNFVTNFYLISLDQNEFVIMAYSNGQTILYNRIKGK